jgi:predicted metal-dependent HD superfamily phosphohydrolase
LLARERIFLSPLFHARLEDQARANLRSALDSVPGSAPGSALART